MEKKKLVILVVSMLLLVGIFGVIAVTITNSETNTQAGADGADSQAKADASKDSEKGGQTAEGGGKEAAGTLIDKTVSRDEVKESVGEWDRFEMDGNGCERGVYAGKFYYGDFTIYSRTYDKGETFHIMSVNE